MAKAAKKAVAKAGEAMGEKTKILGAYKQMLTFQFVGTFVLVVLISAYLLFCYAKSWPPPLLLLVMLAGILGAFFSALTRLYNVDQASIALITPTVQLLGGRYLLMYSFVPPIVGAIASVVLYLVFVGGFVEGGLFPNISCAEGKTCNALGELMENYSPTEPQDYGRALVWGFIAGFSERFVPDLLQSLVAKQGKEGKP